MSPEANSHWVSEDFSFVQGLLACWLCNYVVSQAKICLAARVLRMESNDEAAESNRAPAECNSGSWWGGSPTRKRVPHSFRFRGACIPQKPFPPQVENRTTATARVHVS